MEPNAAADPAVMLTWALVLVNSVIYLIFKGVAIVANKIAGRNVLHRRWSGAIAVMVFTAFAVWYMRVHFVNADLYARLSPFDQGRYVGRITGTALVPGLLVLAVVGVRGWRQSKRLARERAQARLQADGSAPGDPAA